MRLARLGLASPDKIGLVNPFRIDKGVCGLGGRSCRGLVNAPGGSPRIVAGGGNTNLGLVDIEASGKVCGRLIFTLLPKPPPRAGVPLLRGQERSRLTGRGIDNVCGRDIAAGPLLPLVIASLVDLSKLPFDS